MCLARSNIHSTHFGIKSWQILLLIYGIQDAIPKSKKQFLKVKSKMDSTILPFWILQNICRASGFCIFTMLIFDGNPNLSLGVTFV